MGIKNVMYINFYGFDIEKFNLVIIIINFWELNY